MLNFNTLCSFDYVNTVKNVLDAVGYHSRSCKLAIINFGIVTTSVVFPS